ncbi:uncharacterized protein K452DRAFT_299682 [Aplosporella prunicola CBS 121167]|uniref:Nuclear pore complex component n=1 Tax=Aplosporella prunicola CBS 121167 TaxID=1176127 RepID=A0A6A6BAP8_9PEZI|nr:uncharacterized protein K452DRAFT_299682 [Aplosporella prunicola CBS 121167]KAF2140324.1 hypothetical protein K452DRAFT_299682 [Aplosporella prunicola CBS 121167]
MASPATGTWRHPRFEEITRRQSAATFGEAHAKSLISSLIILFLTFVFPAFTPTFVNTQIPKAFHSVHINPAFIVWLLRALLSFNCFLSVAPLFRAKDPLVDIPLTPSQRALLGLDPTLPSAPGTPESPYVTPPRYARSATPRSNDKHLSQRRNGSPYSGSPRLDSSYGYGDSGSPFSPSASPLLQKAVGGAGASKRMSYSTSSLLDSSFGQSGLTASPTPLGANGKGPSVGLNNRWLYERGRGSPGARAIYS